MTEADERLLAVKHNIATRLRPVCADWPSELFETMVTRLAAITLKYESVTALPGYDRRTTERLLADLKAALEESEARHREKESDPGPR
jgi:hypothetical protein